MGIFARFRWSLHVCAHFEYCHRAFAARFPGKGNLGLPVEPIPRYNGLLLAINGENAGEVDAIFERAVAAGASVQQKPVWKDWDGKPGYSGFIMDPDGYVWELAYAPALRIGEDNRLLPTTKAEAAAGKDT